MEGVLRGWIGTGGRNNCRVVNFNRERCCKDWKKHSKMLVIPLNCTQKGMKLIY